MDEAPVTPMSITLVESSAHASTAWSMSNGNPIRQKPKADILAMPERLNEVPEWLRTPLYRFLRLKQRNWPAKDCPTLNQTAFQSIEPHHILFHPTFWVVRMATTCPKLARRLH